MQVGNESNPVTADDYFSLSYVSSCSTSPSGHYTAWTEGRWDKDLDRRNYDIWISPTHGERNPARITFDEANDGSLQWGESDEWLYFSSRRGSKGETLPRNGKKQIWRIKPNGTQLMAVTRLESGVIDWTLSDDGKSVYYTLDDETQVDDDWKQLRKDHDDIEYGHGIVDYSELWKLDLRSWKHELIWDEDRVIQYFSPSPSEETIAIITTPDNRLITNEGLSTIGIYDVDTQETTLLDDTLWREETASPYGWIESPDWSTDGFRLVFTVDFDGYPMEMFVATFKEDRTTIQKVTRFEEVSVGSPPQWSPKSHDLLYIAEQGTTRPLLEIEQVGDGKQGKTNKLVASSFSCWSFSISDNPNDVSIVVGSKLFPPVVAVISQEQHGISVIANPNKFVEEWDLPTITSVEWDAPDGTKIEGVLEYPSGYKLEQGSLPLYVHLHGGPTSASTSGLTFSMHGRGVLSTDGWAVLSPNYRGSTGYGDKFLTALIGHENDIEVQDILAGVDAMIERGIANPDQLAIGGWSNGGYLTNCIIATTDRFKAASSGAGVFDQTMQWSIEDTPGHVINYAKGLPWEVPQELNRMSPLFEADKITTPTIIHVGAGDERVPAEQSKALYRALYDYLDVPSQLVIYPGTGHSLSKMSHRRAKMNWDRTWLDRWVFGIVP